MARDNLSYVLAVRPKPNIVPGTTFEPKVTPAPTAEELQDGQILVEVLYLSIDPAMRGWLNDERSYLPPVQIGQVMRGATVARVLASKSSQAAVGDVVSALAGWTQYAILKEGQFEPTSQFPGLKDPKDIHSLLGLSPITAWVGMTQIGKPKAGETVVVSGAAGATGSVAGQIAKISGARVIGIAGSDDKCKWLVEELGFDVALNYKDPEFRAKFKEATPNFIDVYFDNVGGDILDTCLNRAKEFSRFVICGNISQYNAANPQGPRYFSRIITMRIHVQGFIVMDHADRYPEARRDLSTWASEGKLKRSEHVVKGGLKNAEQGLIDLFAGANTGKLLIEVKDPNESPVKL